MKPYLLKCLLCLIFVISCKTIETKTDVKVEITGSVNKPGFYTITSIANFQQILQLAGGYSPAENANSYSSEPASISLFRNGKKTRVPYRINKEINTTPIILKNDDKLVVEIWIF